MKKKMVSPLFHFIPFGRFDGRIILIVTYAHTDTYGLWLWHGYVCVSRADVIRNVSSRFVVVVGMRSKLAATKQRRAHNAEFARI